MNDGAVPYCTVPSAAPGTPSDAAVPLATVTTVVCLSGLVGPAETASETRDVFRVVSPSSSSSSVVHE